MKKILCLIDTLGFRGGAERQLIGLVQMLRKRGYETDVVIYHDNPYLLQIYEGHGIMAELLKTKANRLSKFLAVRKYIKIKGGYDCIITYKDGPNFIGCLLKCFGGNFKLIVSERNTTQEINIQTRIGFTLYRFADYIVPNSHSQAAFIQTNFPRLKSKVVTINNFTDTELFIDRTVMPNAKRTVLTVARISHQKNVLNYLSAISILVERGITNIHFDWYGDVQSGEESYMSEVLNSIETLNLSNIITFHPATIDIVPIYQSCDIFCLPSNYEGFPNVVCEAMSCGKAIACSRVCDNMRIVSEDRNGILFDPSNPEDIADKLEKIISMSDEQLIKWGESSRLLAEQSFSKDRFVDKYIHLIER